MSKKDIVSSRYNHPLRDQFHPGIYRLAGGLVVWFVLSAWLFFDRQNDTDLPLTFVSVLLLIALLLPWVLSRLWRRYGRTTGAASQAASLHDWAFGDFAVWQARLHGAHAAIDMLLPLAAVAFGLTAIGIVFVVIAQTTH